MTDSLLQQRIDSGSRAYSGDEDFYRSFLFWCDAMALKLQRQRIVAALRQRDARNSKRRESADNA